MLIEHPQWLACGMKQFTDLSIVERIIADLDFLRLLRDRGQIEMNPAVRIRLVQMPHQVVLMEPLHDDDDHAILLVVEAGQQCSLEPVYAAIASDFRRGILGFDRIIDDDEVPAAPGKRAADRSGVPEPALHRHELGVRYL